MKDVTIIGAGAVGIASALSIIESGQSVEVYDRDAPASGASHGNAGVISPWSFVPQAMPGVWKSVPKWLLDPNGPLAVRWSHLPRFLPYAMRFIRAGDPARLPAIADALQALNHDNVDLYRHHLKGTGQEGLIRDACYVHAYRNADAIDLNHLQWRLRAERGAPLRIVKGAELFDVEPALSREFKAAVLIEQQGRTLDPGALGRALASKAEGLGAAFHRAGVHGLKPSADGNWVLQTDQGERPARVVVVAAGAWSLKLLKPLGLNVPLEAERGYHVVLRDPGIEVNHSVLDTDAKFVASSMSAGIRCAGTAEFAGLDAPPNWQRAEALRRGAKRLFPDINVDDFDRWMGSRPSFPDSLPGIGPVPGQRNLYAAFGHGHMGLMMAPATGRVVAQLVAGRAPNIDMKPYSFNRF